MRRGQRRGSRHDGRRPVLIGVNFAGLAGCPLGGDGVFVNVGAPEVLLFVAGRGQPSGGAAPLRYDLDRATVAPTR